MLQYCDNVTIIVTVWQYYNITISCSEIVIQYHVTICYNMWFAHVQHCSATICDNMSYNMALQFWLTIASYNLVLQSCTMYGQIVPYPFWLAWYCSSVLLDKLSHIVVKLSELVHAVQLPGRAAAGSLSLAASRLPQDAMLHCSAALPLLCWSRF